MVGASGFEPPTSWSRTRRSSQAEPRPDFSILSCGSNWYAELRVRRPLQVGFCVSGGGRLFRDAARLAAQLDVRITAVLCARKDEPAYAGFCRQSGISLISIDQPNRRAFDEEIATRADRAALDLIVLTFNRIIPGPMVARYRERIINMHPGLLPEFPGARLESKGLALAVHYRGLGPSRRIRLHRCVKRVAARAGLAILPGKQVWDLVPAGHRGKAEALGVIRARLKVGVRAGRLLTVYAGDDATDAEAFRALPRRAVGIQVGGARGKAPFRLRNVRQVHALLRWIAERAAFEKKFLSELDAYKKDVEVRVAEQKPFNPVEAQRFLDFVFVRRGWARRQRQRQEPIFTGSQPSTPAPLVDRGSRRARSFRAGERACRPVLDTFLRFHS